jgi:hypothetical protein
MNTYNRRRKNPGTFAGNIMPAQSHLIGDIVFENIKVFNYRDEAEFTRYGRGKDHKRGGLIKEHFLVDFTTDNWILWEGANRMKEHAAEPDIEGKRKRVEFWENKIKFIINSINPLD